MDDYLSTLPGNFCYRLQDFSGSYPDRYRAVFYANISKTEGEIVTDCVFTMIIFTVCRSFTLTDSV